MVTAPLHRVLWLLVLLGCGPGPAADVAPVPPDAGLPGPDGAALPADATPQPGGDVRPPDEAGAAPDASGDRTSNPGAERPADGGLAARSAGCGKPATGTSRYERRTIAVAGVEREYFLWVPRGYDPARAYPLVFRWHGTGGNGTSGGLEIEQEADEDGLVVSPSGIGGVWSLQAEGPDVALFDALLVHLGDALCVDRGRVFSYGFSLGAAFTNLLGCVRAGVLRAVAPVDGLPGGDHCTAKVAAWITHGTADTTVPIAVGTAIRDRYLGVDGCAATALPEAPSPCVRYQGCAPGYPVVWCKTASEHDPQARFTAPGAWSFFRSLPPLP
jgi:polyhydroxybutyrate depolymerase